MHVPTYIIILFGITAKGFGNRTGGSQWQTSRGQTYGGPLGEKRQSGRDGKDQTKTADSGPGRRFKSRSQWADESANENPGLGGKAEDDGKSIG